MSAKLHAVAVRLGFEIRDYFKTHLS